MLQWAKKKIMNSAYKIHQTEMDTISEISRTDLLA